MVLVARKFGKYFATSFISKVVHLMRVVVTLGLLFIGSESESSSSSIREGCKSDGVADFVPVGTAGSRMSVK